ncbi:MAG: class I SAM-dependent methyltransferase [Erysipelotrichaceae bacterium]|nr:class I SAM-dependent methyltransferase [Erysipelotrichaceae bacterium]
MTHYFSDNTDLPHNYKRIEFIYNNINFIFYSDIGVFSKSKVDEGTMVLLDVVNKEELKGKVLDLGCGYGVVSIVLKKSFDLSIDGVDINPRAIVLSKENSKRNKTSINYFVSDGFSNVVSMYDEILVNPPIRAGKKVIYKMFNDAYDHLNVNGNLWIVIRKQQGASSAINEISSKFSNCQVIEKKKGYWVLKATKY